MLHVVQGNTLTLQNAFYLLFLFHVVLTFWLCFDFELCVRCLGAIYIYVYINGYVSRIASTHFTYRCYFVLVFILFGYVVMRNNAIGLFKVYLLVKKSTFMKCILEKRKYSDFIVN